MRDYAIVTDATCDLPKPLVDEWGITVLPMEFHMGQMSYMHQTGWCGITAHEFYEQLRQGNGATTSQVAMQVYLDTFAQLLEQGKDILYLAFSSGLSGSYQTALVAKEELAASHPESKIAIIDTLCASSGEGLLVWLAAQQRHKGATLEQTVQWVEQHKLHICHWFTVDDLAHLKRGGRISGMTAALGTMLNVKPILRVDDMGHLVSVSKARGRKKAIAELVQQVMEGMERERPAPVFIGHADSVQDAVLLKEKLEQSGVKDIILTEVGPIIGTHSGPATLLVVFLGNKR